PNLRMRSSNGSRRSTTRFAGTHHSATSAPSTTNAFTARPTKRHDHHSTRVRETAGRSVSSIDPRTPSLPTKSRTVWSWSGRHLDHYPKTVVPLTKADGSDKGRSSAAVVTISAGG